MTEPVFLDLETTGMRSDDEILEIAICDRHGHPILNSLINPLCKKEWPEAQAIHGISPEDVANAPSITELSDKIRQAVAGRVVVIYNKAFDTAFLGGLLNGAKGVRCAMERWAEYKGEYREKDGKLKWHKLITAAEEAGHDWGQGAAHRALEG